MSARRVLLLACALTAPLAASDRAERDLFAGFTDGWRRSWSVRDMAERGNVIALDEADGDRVLRVSSDGSASALWRPVDPELQSVSSLSWRWRVSASLDHLDDERSKGQDDYAARLAVMFDGKPFGRRTPTLMYVWAGRESVGSVYPSPYSNNVATIVLRSGTPATDAWHIERRDVRADFEAFFGRRPLRMTGVALMVDTDNTSSRATAWFDDLVVDAPPRDPAGS